MYNPFLSFFPPFVRRASAFRYPTRNVALHNSLSYLRASTLVRNPARARRRRPFRRISQADVVVLPALTSSHLARRTVSKVATERRREGASLFQPPSSPGFSSQDSVRRTHSVDRPWRLVQNCSDTTTTLNKAQKPIEKRPHRPLEAFRSPRSDLEPPAPPRSRRPRQQPSCSSSSTCSWCRRRPRSPWESCEGGEWGGSAR
ncbi:hypothetical protein BCR35DRAFT_6751 [Leucosporidium creatinivorum]|uniref:Uncharacterized protein n=1 Tax=Leucosporidium creatinivorum TaxID=106004 RepID=A0A1Y2G463_9BASI|nr:hypothetical protein BCR35DRAFT_6751 [Leucosporidium creatinivorum]